MKTCVYGRSEFILAILGKKLSVNELSVVSWREPAPDPTFYDQIFVIGFDKGLYTKIYRNFILDGYMKQLLFVARLKRVNPHLKIYYINTHSTSSISFSRYEAAKNRLAYKLSLLGHFHQICPDTIVDDNGEFMHVKKGLYAKCLGLLVKLKILKTCSLTDFTESIVQMLDRPSLGKEDLPCQKYILLKYARPPIIDKLLKLLTL
jgi:hypothetical protein